MMLLWLPGRGANGPGGGPGTRAGNRAGRPGKAPAPALRSPEA